MVFIIFNFNLLFCDFEIKKLRGRSAAEMSGLTAKLTLCSERTTRKTFLKDLVPKFLPNGLDMALLSTFEQQAKKENIKENT